MYGFLITRGAPPQETPLENPKTLSYGDVRFYYSPLPKFENDHLFYEDGEKIVLLDGVIFNNHELMEARGCGSWRETVDQMIREDARTCQKELRGSFCGALLEKGSGDLVLFTNQSGEKTVYYARREGLFVAASHNNILTPVLKNQGFPVEPDIQAHRELLCCGRILRNNTPFRNVHRLMGGKCLLAGNARCEELRYHMFRNLPEHEMTLKECEEELDRRFRKAVDRIFAKNKEYGYQGVCDLSGGLDGRMVTWVAHDLGYSNILNVCYSQKNTIDHAVSRKIAHDLGNDYFFLPMDGGDLLMDIDEMVDKFGGQVTYIICSGANRSYQALRSRNIALSATGLIAGEYQGAFIEGDSHTPPNYVGPYSTVVPFLLPEDYKTDYDNYEHMALYERDLPLIMNSVLIRQQICEAASPYADVEFLEFAYRIPIKWRKDRHMCMTWIVDKYPGAARYVYQHARMPLDKFYRHQIYVPKLAADARRFVLRCFNKAGRMLHLPMQFTLNDEMNPVDQWYRTNRRLREFLDGYYRENIQRVADPRLQEDVRKTFEQGGAVDKLQAVNLLAVYKRYF